MCKNTEISICLSCDMEDTYTSNGDVGWCSECYTVEGGFKYIDENGEVI